jgi:hypothetical protein
MEVAGREEELEEEKGGGKRKEFQITSPAVFD